MLERPFEHGAERDNKGKIDLAFSMQVPSLNGWLEYAALRRLLVAGITRHRRVVLYASKI